MAYQATVYRVLIASPSDVSAERLHLPTVIMTWNLENSLEKKVVLEPVRWETHSYPAAGDRPQSILNKQIVTSSDILIGVFWTRLGSPTGEAESGTVEEINEFIKQGKPVQLYFSKQPVVPGSIEPDEYKRLSEFKQEIKSKGYYFEYSTPSEFYDLVRRHLSQQVGRLTTSRDESEGVSALPTSSSDPAPNQRSIAEQFLDDWSTWLRLEQVRFDSEREALQPSADDVKKQMMRVTDELMKFLARLSFDDGGSVSELLRTSIIKAKEITKYPLYLDGGKSIAAFWHEGQALFRQLNKITEVMQNVTTSLK